MFLWRSLGLHLRERTEYGVDQTIHPASRGQPLEPRVNCCSLVALVEPRGLQRKQARPQVSRLVEKSGGPRGRTPRASIQDLCCASSSCMGEEGVRIHREWHRFACYFLVMRISLFFSFLFCVSLLCEHHFKKKKKRTYHTPVGSVSGVRIRKATISCRFETQRER
jgi:hypothetical protein